MSGSGQKAIGQERMVPQEAEDSKHTSCVEAPLSALVIAEWSMAGGKKSKKCHWSIWAPKISVVCLQSKYLPEFTEPPNHFLPPKSLRQLGSVGISAGAYLTPLSYVLLFWAATK